MKSFHSIILLIFLMFLVLSMMVGCGARTGAVTKPTVPQTCSSDLDCGTGKICGAVGTCEIEVPPGGGGNGRCTTTNDCPAGTYCNDTYGTCRDLPDDDDDICQSPSDCDNYEFCNSDGVCEPSANVERCSSDSECDAEYFCNSDHVCEFDLNECEQNSECDPPRDGIVVKYFIPTCDNEDATDGGDPDCVDASGKDSDGDGFMDDCDFDIDGDCFENEDDNCPYNSNPNQLNDIDEDGIGDFCDEDMDGDGYKDKEATDIDGVFTSASDDNCPRDYNPTQADLNGNNIGNRCDGSYQGLHSLGEGRWIEKTIREGGDMEEHSYECGQRGFISSVAATGTMDSDAAAYLAALFAGCSELTNQGLVNNGPLDESNAPILFDVFQGTAASGKSEDTVTRIVPRPNLSVGIRLAYQSGDGLHYLQSLRIFYQTIEQLRDEEWDYEKTAWVLEDRQGDGIVNGDNEDQVYGDDYRQKFSNVFCDYQNSEVMTGMKVWLKNGYGKVKKIAIQCKPIIVDWDDENQVNNPDENDPNANYGDNAEVEPEGETTQ